MDPVMQCTTLPSHSESLRRFLSDTYTGNPIKKILLKLNLPDHRLVLTDSEVKVKMEVEIPRSSGVNFITTCSYSFEKIQRLHESSKLVTNDHNNEPSSSKLVPNVSPSADTITPSLQELDLLFSPLYDEFFTAGNSKPITPTVHAKENTDNQAEDAHFQSCEFINPFFTPEQDVAESSSRNVDNSNMHTFYQRHQSEHRWTKDHPLEQVHGNPSKPVQTRRQLAIHPEMYMFALIVSTSEPKNIKEPIADHAWIEAMQEELHQFDKLNVWELVDKPFGKTVIKLKWL
ncbi:hypothetical protein Tco_1554935 [Tanacetum coccineum]